MIDGTIGVTTGGQDAPLVFGKLDVVGDIAAGLGYSADEVIAAIR